MSQFDQALNLVHDTLTQMREHGSNPLARAAKDSLQAFIESTAADRPAASPDRPSDSPASTPAPLGLAARARAAMAAAVEPERAQPPPSSAAPAATDPPKTKAERMAALRERALVCIKCPHLAASRTQVVFGVGNIDAELMFVGEAPGADEDIQGEPFVGRAGQLLTKIIEAMGFKREDVYIANVLKCRPDMPPNEPGNRKPRPEEMATCLPYLVEQIDIIRPKCLVALGATAMEGLLGKETPMRELRGRWHSFKGIPLMATYHPAYLLRNQSNTEKRKVWEDMMQVLELLGRPITEKQRGYFLSK